MSKINPNAQVPVLPIKIIRKGETLHLTYGKATCELKEIDGMSQVYSGLLLDKFVSDHTMLYLKEFVDAQQAIKLHEAAFADKKQVKADDEFAKKLNAGIPLNKKTKGKLK